MSYDIFVNGKYQQQIASNNGWHTTARWLRQHGGPMSKMLATKGECTDGSVLSQEIDNVIDVAPEEIKSVLRDIAKYYTRGSHIGIAQ